MTKSFPKTGILPALWLPTDESGSLLKSELDHNLGFIKSHGVHGVLALGSTGEFPQLEVEHRKQALATVIELAGDLPVIANISDIRPRVVAELGRFAREVGACGVAIMPPGFFPSSQGDLLMHFLHAAESAGLPTLLYNFPELTGTRIDLETVEHFARRANMAGIKQSGGEFDYHLDLIALGRERGFSVFSGSDTRLPEVFSLGAAGCIGGLVNIAPDLMVHLYRVCHDNEEGDIAPAFERLQKIGQTIEQMTFPLNVAAGMEARGLATGTPKALVSPESALLYQKVVAELRGLFETWELPMPSALQGAVL